MKTAWYIEDDGEMIQAIRLLLKLLDYDTRAFLDCRTAAKAILQGERPDIMIIDINMPIVSGMDLLKYVRSRSDLDDMPVVMLSSEVADASVNEATEFGADGYLFKPVTVDDLEDKINIAIKKRSR